MSTCFLFCLWMGLSTPAITYSQLHALPIAAQQKSGDISQSDNDIVGVLFAPAVASYGNPVFISLSFINTGEREARFAWVSSPPSFDILIEDKDGHLLRNRLFNKLMTDDLSLTRLSPGKSVKFYWLWDGKDNTGRFLAPGTYTIRGVVPYAPLNEENVPTGLRTITTPPKSITIHP